MSRSKDTTPAAGPPSRSGQGGGRTQASKEKSPGPRLPNERDESADSQAAPDPSHKDVMEQAYEDAASGQPDTGKGPVLDEVYNDELSRRGRPPRQ